MNHSKMNIRRFWALLGIVTFLGTTLTTRNSSRLCGREFENNTNHRQTHLHVHDDNCNHGDELEQKNHSESYQRLNHVPFSKSYTTNDTITTKKIKSKKMVSIHFVHQILIFFDVVSILKWFFK